MQFSAALLATFAANASAFSTAPINAVKSSLSAATLEVETKAEAAPINGEAAVAPITTDNGVEKDWPVSDDKFVKDSERVVPGRYNGIDYSLTLPFLPRPTNLDGSHAGDYGFDPLGLSNGNSMFDLYSMQESEVRHARLAMLAVVGWPMAELLAPDWLLQENGMAPSVLNGFNPLTFLATAAAFGAFGFFESQTSLRSNTDTDMGRTHTKDMSAVWKYGVAGDYNWDPLNLYSSCGDDSMGRKGLRDVELSHGRVAMLGITYFALWEGLTNHPIVENNMLFHPNLMFPLLAAGTVAWNQIYEVSDLTSYPITVQYTNEGEMKLEGVKQALKKSSDNSKVQFDNLDAKFGIVQKIDDLGIGEKLTSLVGNSMSESNVGNSEPGTAPAKTNEEGSIVDTMMSLPQKLVKAVKDYQGIVD